MDNTFLQAYVMQYFAAEAKVLSTALFVPLGPKVDSVMQKLSERGIIDPERLLSGLEHPSSNNSERIAYLLGRKSREELSPKTNPTRIDRARTSLQEKTARLIAAVGNE